MRLFSDKHGPVFVSLSGQQLEWLGIDLAVQSAERAAELRVAIDDWKRTIRVYHTPEGITLRHTTSEHSFGFPYKIAPYTRPKWTEETVWCKGAACGPSTNLRVGQWRKFIKPAQLGAGDTFMIQMMNTHMAQVSQARMIQAMSRSEAAL